MQRVRIGNVCIVRQPDPGWQVSQRGM